MAVVGLTSQGADPTITRSQLVGATIGAYRTASLNGYTSSPRMRLPIVLPTSLQGPATSSGLSAGQNGVSDPAVAPSQTSSQDPSDAAATTAGQILQLIGSGSTATTGVGSDVATEPTYNVTQSTAASGTSPVLIIVVLAAATLGFFFFRKHHAGAHGHGGANEPLLGLHL